MQYTTETTAGYSVTELTELNRIYDHRISLLEEEDRENADRCQQISEDVLYDYDQARDLVPDALVDGDGNENPIHEIIDLEIRGAGDDRAAIALVNLTCGLSGVLVVIYPNGEQITQGDWQLPSVEIPTDLAMMRWQHLPPYPDAVIVCGDGLPRYISLW
ncbi:MAG: hypothetical protein PHR28_08990 [candidate division Zixibacteria bacterium]|jgi:hypothetical protein|nr:hypothetical protein [candidate division Zixibacteria bacterium]